MDQEVADALAELEKRTTALEVQAQERQVSKTHTFKMSNLLLYGFAILVNISLLALAILGFYR